MSVQIRPESPADASAVRTVVAEAFGDASVADLVESLRSSPGYRPDLALVAVDDATITGHVMLTGVPLYQPDGGVREILCLSPLSVHPRWQRTGIGRALTEAAVRRADERGEALVILEGDPALYSRFGFVPASRHGLHPPSPTIPEPALQAYPLTAYRADLGGQVGYPAAFWAAGAAGRPEPVEATGRYAVPWLFQLARYAGWIGAATADADLSREVPACPGLTVADVLRHLGTIYRVVRGWIEQGRRPVDVPDPTGDERDWFAEGWRALYPVLAAVSPDAPAASWCPWDATMGFWRRRMVHETAIHAHDVLSATDPDGPSWTVQDAVALDGIDEALRLWLGTRLGDQHEGSGRLVRVAVNGGAPGTMWTVGLHRHIAEVHQLPTDPDAVLHGDPATLYRWLWGRATWSEVQVSGDADAVTQLRRALALAMR